MTASSVRVRGLLDTGNEHTTYRFDYLTVAAYEANQKAGSEGFQGALHIPVGPEANLYPATEDLEVAQRIAGLSAGTPYRYRLVAKNASGEGVGPERAFTTQEASLSFVLAEGRGWEMVSPIDKNSGAIGFPESLFGGGAFQAASQGGSVTYGSTSSFGEGRGAAPASQYFSTRSSSGWQTANVTLATQAGAFGSEPDGVPYRLFSGDLDRALALAEPHVFELLAIPGLDSLGSLAAPDLRFAGATPDLSHIVFSTCQALTADAVEVPGGGGDCDPGFPNLYLWGEGELRLLNLEPGDSTGTPKAALAAQVGAIFAAGARVYWVDREGALMLRDGARTVVIDSDGDFQAASSDGSIAYFTKAAHLYRYSLATESSVDLTPGGEVIGVLGASGDASYAYFLDDAGVELWHEGAVTPVAADADPSSYPPTTGTARVSASGTRLAFLSDQPLTSYESLGANELFLYQADSGKLICVSCNPNGVKPIGPTTIPGAVANGSEVHAYRPRVMDPQGTRLFFETEDALSAKDSNGEPDVYEWWAPGVGGCTEPDGCVGPISSGKSAEPSRFIDASADGTDVFFLAEDSLASSDPGSVDVYDARIGGGFPDPPVPMPCVGDACQPLPPEPEDPQPGTLFYASEVNPKLHLHRRGKNRRKHKHKRRHKQQRETKRRARGR